MGKWLRNWRLSGGERGNGEAGRSKEVGGGGIVVEMAGWELKVNMGYKVVKTPGKKVMLVRTRERKCVYSP